MIDQGEFAIQDLITKRDVNLDLPWETCFRPGQKVAMSMIFKSTKSEEVCCPKCKDSNEGNGEYGNDIEWYVRTFQTGFVLTMALSRKCKMVYRQSRIISSAEPLAGLDIAISTELDMVDAPFEPRPVQQSRKRRRAQEEDDEITPFHRVRIETEIKVPAAVALTNSAAAQKIQAMIFENLQQQTPAPLTGWRGLLLVEERMGLIFNMSVLALHITCHITHHY